MGATKESDTLSELRLEYKSVKKELNKYDSFTDNHPFLCIFTPFALSIVVVIIASIASSLWLGILALVLFIVSIIMFCIVLARAGKISKINAKLDGIEHEVKLFHSKPTTVGSDERHSVTSGDELGLWRDIEQQADGSSHSSKGSWVLGVIVIVVIASVISFNQANEREQKSAERARQTQIIEQQQTKQQQDAIEQQKIDQQDEANRLQQQKNAIDLYNNTKPSSNDNYRSGSSCTSRVVGSTMYTDCN